VLRALASDQQLLAIARQYLGTEPALIGARMWWSFVGPADSAQQVKAGRGFHYDVYVRGTHVRKSWRRLVSLSKARSDKEIEERYGL
jgi:hypothetical protein